ncbi:MAG TPA: DNA mismatch repair protein MutS [Thermoplasmata archaeon]|nr:DNA mismatch repair protein MutS [Thermoplasmata archaeon]
MAASPSGSASAPGPAPHDPGGFSSVLDPAGIPPEPPPPEFADPLATDLNLGVLVERLLKGREEYDLGVFFRAPPTSLETVRYRQAVALDLADPPIRSIVIEFAHRFRESRADFQRAAKRYHPLQQARWMLSALSRYHAAVVGLDEGLSAAPIRSDAFRALREYVREYRRSPSHRALGLEIQQLDAALSRIQYLIAIRGRRVTVSPYRGEVDYAARIDATFARFERAAEKEYRFSLPQGADTNPVEGQILDCVAMRFPEAFARLRALAAGGLARIDPVLKRFDREAQFFLVWQELVDRLAAQGLACALPELDPSGREVEVRDAFDVVLAAFPPSKATRVVTNDFRLSPPEQFLVVTGPNQGGKTTFARTFGQVFHFARLGLAVPARGSRLPFVDRVYSHFGREERPGSERGRLQDDLLRLRAIQERATSSSVVVLNESFGSTSSGDAVAIGRAVLADLAQRGVIGVCVTFLDELSRLGPATVSVVAGVEPNDPRVRTFRIERRPADGRAYAVALAEQHGLGYAELRRRVAS